jgi:membrane protein DedA with SNARE-associated domain
MNFINYFLNIFGHLGYFGIIILMAMESSIFPLPSEVVIPPAAYLASRGGMNIWLIILAGTLGSILGATIMYFVSLKLGRVIVYSLLETKLAKILFLNKEKLVKAENFFLKYGNTSVFVGRLLPVIRHLISIPAGFCRMNFLNFIFYTAVGSFIWVSVLAWGTYFFGKKAEAIIAVFKDWSEIIIIIALAISVFIAIFYFLKKSKKK